MKDTISYMFLFHKSKQKTNKILFYENDETGEKWNEEDDTVKNI